MWAEPFPVIPLTKPTSACCVACSSQWPVLALGTSVKTHIPISLLPQGSRATSKREPWRREVSPL